jgi:glycogen operon protein
VSYPSAPQELGVSLSRGRGEIRVFSAHATGIDLVVFDAHTPDRVADRVHLKPGKDFVWSGKSSHLVEGATYALQAWGPQGPNHLFNPEALLVDPYATGVIAVGPNQWRSVVVDHEFDWEGVTKPNIEQDKLVIYEGHIRGLTKQRADVPLELRGTYLGLGHENMIAYLKDLGITSVELLPIHIFNDEHYLQQQGMVNYWGYNTLNYFTPESLYATREARDAGPAAVIREFKQMVKNLHAAGIEVILDVVYNHTAEEGPGGPISSLRGLDNATYYRQTDDGTYIDVTGCGNSLDTSKPAVAGLILDSLRYWAREMQVDGFRFDLAVTLGRNAVHEYEREHPLLEAIRTDPFLSDVKLIAEPWDTGMGGWQTGNFAPGWMEWNDRYRDRARNFWLLDIAHAREHGAPPTGIGGFATRLAGSSNTFSEERGPIASVNFVTAHDGFTLADLTTYNYKHNIGNSEDNRDGSNDNRSFNHGVEGPADDPAIISARRKAMRNLLGTLLLSAGIPMLTAGDEHGRTQHGNNNAYCHDSPLTWINWELQPWQEDLLATTKLLLQLRRENSALRPLKFGRFGETIPNASQMDWFNALGKEMSAEDWDDPKNRTLQYLAASTPVNEPLSRILLIVHGVETTADVVVPAHEGVSFYEPLWFSTNAAPREIPGVLRPGETIKVGGTSMLLFKAS